MEGESCDRANIERDFERTLKRLNEKEVENARLRRALDFCEERLSQTLGVETWLAKIKELREGTT